MCSNSSMLHDSTLGCVTTVPCTVTAHWDVKQQFHALWQHTGKCNNSSMHHDSTLGCVTTVLCTMTAHWDVKQQFHAPLQHTGMCNNSSMHYKEVSVHVHCLATWLLQKGTLIPWNQRMGRTQNWVTHLEKNVFTLSDIYWFFIRPTCTPVTIPNELAHLAKT
jgi:hypothetical protein